MGNARKYFPLLAAAGLLASGAAQATLFDRGGGLLYDDVLKVTWLQDANYAKTSGYDLSIYGGKMTWTDANNWAEGLSYGGYTDWRLPRASPVGSDWNYSWSVDGSTDYGYNITSPLSELTYMYYVNLGLRGYYSPTGDYQPDYGIFRNGTGGVGDQANVGLVKNLQAYVYWTATAYAGWPDYVWGFGFGDGGTGGFARNPYTLFGAWAVRDGDGAVLPGWVPPPVVVVPEPETYALFLAGLAVMGGVLRRRRGFGPS